MNPARCPEIFAVDQSNRRGSRDLLWCLPCGKHRSALERSKFEVTSPPLPEMPATESPRLCATPKCNKSHRRMVVAYPLQHYPLQSA